MQPEMFQQITMAICEDSSHSSHCHECHGQLNPNENRKREPNLEKRTRILKIKRFGNKSSSKVLKENGVPLFYTFLCLVY